MYSCYSVSKYLSPIQYPNIGLSLNPKPAGIIVIHGIYRDSLADGTFLPIIFPGVVVRVVWEQYGNGGPIIGCPVQPVG